MIPHFPYSFGRVVREVRAGFYRTRPHREQYGFIYRLRSVGLLLRMLVYGILTAVEDWRRMQGDFPYEIGRKDDDEDSTR